SGVYRVKVRAIRVGPNGELRSSAARHTVTIGEPPPPPPPPLPPAQSDALFAPLQAAYAADGAPAPLAAGLAFVYRNAARPGGTADAPGLSTAADLFRVMAAAGQ